MYHNQTDINNNVHLLLNKDAMKEGNTIINFVKDIVLMFVGKNLRPLCSPVNWNSRVVYQINEDKPVPVYFSNIYKFSKQLMTEIWK